MIISSAKGYIVTIYDGIDAFQPASKCKIVGSPIGTRVRI
jgi:hypothetical protein